MGIVSETLATLASIAAPGRCGSTGRLFRTGDTARVSCSLAHLGRHRAYQIEPPEMSTGDNANPELGSSLPPTTETPSSERARTARLRQERAQEAFVDRGETDGAEPSRTVCAVSSKRTGPSSSYPKQRARSGSNQAHSERTKWSAEFTGVWRVGRSRAPSLRTSKRLLSSEHVKS
jgi:hypothetical protein